MVCIYCGGETDVTNSRPRKRSNSVWRRRKCRDCHTVFTSSETLELAGSILVSCESRTEPFSRDKLLLSIHESLKHRKDPLGDAKALTDTVLNQILTVVTSPKLDEATITEVCYRVLKKFDKTAATYYEAFHHH